MGRQQSVNASKSSPILRLTSATEEQKQSFVSFLGAAVDLNTKVTHLLSLDFPVTIFRAQRQLEEFHQSSEEEMRITQEAEDEARREHVRRVEARGQRGYVHQNTKIILNDIEKFRQF
jgi:SRSO17 transposase